MKKLRFIFLIFIFLAICQNSNCVEAYTIDEVKEKIDFKIVSEEGEPDDYDVLIDAGDLKDNEELPCIETSIESTIYNTNSILDVDFLNDKNTNKNKDWQNVCNIVKVVFKVSRYICLAIMFTLLLYISLVIVMSTVFKKEGVLPLSNILMRKSNGNPKQHMLEKKLIEQWFVSTAVLLLIAYILNIIVSFSNSVTNIADKFKLDKNKDSIVVYVKNSKETVSLSSVIGETTTNGTILNNEIGTYINTEASTGVWAVYAKNLSNDTEFVTYNNSEKMPSASVIKLFIAAAAYDKEKNDSSYKVNETDMKNMITVSDNNAANNLIRDVSKSYINTYISNNGYTSTELNRNFGTTSFSKDNYTSAGDVGKLLENIYGDKCTGASKILEYMKSQQRRSKIPSGIPSDVVVANKTGELGADYPNGPVENDAAIVYKEGANYALVILSSNLGDDSKAIDNINEMSSKIYNGIDGSGLSDSSGTATTQRTFDYYFKTNLEGLLMFESQYKWEDYKGTNIANLITGFIVTCFKIFIYAIFIIRVAVIAIFTAIAPVVVLINGWMTMRGRDNVLIRKWLKIYLYFIFIRSIIGVLYYILIKSNTYVVSKYPLYVLFPIAVIAIVIVVLFRKMVFSRKKKK